MKITAGSLTGLLLWAGFGLTLMAAISGGAAETGSSPARQTLYLGQQVYQVNCAVCHGFGGDGNGPYASMFRVRPRDFRTGLFKFRSTPSGSLPTDDNLLRTVTQGVRWTGMVGRADLGDIGRRAVIQYLKTFSGRFEKEQPGKPINVPPAPPKTKEVVAQGKQLYIELGCAACHGEGGRGDGSSASNLKDDWGWKAWPSDLTWRPLKRGSDTRETYLTLVTGLSGTPMPSYASSLNSSHIWSLVYYLESLVPPDHRLDPNLIIGEEQQGWNAVTMGGMIGEGGMGPGMMRRSR